MSFGEIPLAGGVANAGAVVRVGDTVRRPAGPHSAGVTALLAHLAAVGFEGAPRPLGTDERGRDVLTYVSGDVPTRGQVTAWALTDAALTSVAELLRRFHEAARGFVPPAGVPWAWPPPAAFRTGLVGHNDVCRENVVFRDGRAYALVDFDFAGPSSPAWDMAGVVRHWVLPAPGDRVRRTRLACAAYGIAPAEVVDALPHRIDWGTALVEERAGRGEPAFVAMREAGAFERHRALRAWVAEHAALLAQGLDG